MKTNMGKIQIWIFILLLANHGGTASVTEVHNSTNVTAGESIRLACSKSFDSLVSWQHIPRGNKNRVTICENNDIVKKYELRFSLDVDAASGKYDLLISDVQLFDAGIYYCTDRMLETSVDLTVQKRLRNLVVAPVSSTAFIGNDVRLNCSTSYQDFVYWQHTPYGASSTLDVFAGVFNEPYASNHRYRIEQDAVSGQYDLVISDVQFSDAGRFSCTDNRGFGSRVIVELVVLGVPMLCKTTAGEEGIVVENDCGVKTDILSITCNTSYAGNVVPRLRLRHGDLTFDNASAPIDTVHKNFVSIISSFEIRPTYHMIDNPMSCELPGLPNVPEGDLCSLPKLNIKYFYSSTWVLSQTSVYRHITETKIKCMANSSESCSYKWYESNNPSKILSHDQQFDSRHGRFECLADCTLRGITCSSSASQPIFLDLEKNECNFSGFLLRCSWTAVIPLIVISIAIVYWKRKWCATKLTMLSRNPLTDTVPLMFQGNIEYRKVCLQRVSVITQPSSDKPRNLSNSNNNNEGNIFQSFISFLNKIFSKPMKVKIDKTQEPLSYQECATNEVRGLAFLGDNVYIVRANEKTIEQYNCDTFAYIKSISVKNLSMVRDMVSCSRYKRLYISDEDNNTIHRIRIPRFQNSIARRHIESWLMPHKPDSMSVTPEGDLVVTYWDCRKVIIYNPDGSSKRTFTPPGNPWHALQLMINRFVVFHTSGGENPPAINAISLVSDSGGSIFVFDGDGSYDLGDGRLAATSSEFVFATDYKNSRVLLLDPELKLVDESIISEIQHPSRICFDEKRQRMYVAVENNTKDVYVYKLFLKSEI